jgi:hypothetical protein
MMMGTDFTYADANVWYTNMDQLIKHAVGAPGLFFVTEAGVLQGCCLLPLSLVGWMVGVRRTHEDSHQPPATIQLEPTNRPTNQPTNRIPPIQTRTSTAPSTFSTRPPLITWQQDAPATAGGGPSRRTISSLTPTARTATGQVGRARARL